MRPSSRASASEIPASAENRSIPIFDRVQTDVTVVNNDGSRTETLSNVDVAGVASRGPLRRAGTGKNIFGQVTQMGNA